MTSDPFGLIIRIADLLEGLGIPYALGGSMASSLFGEPRATADVDVAIQLDTELGETLLEQVSTEFYVPAEGAREAIRSHRSFNLLAVEHGFKIDLFVLGDGLLDQRQIARRVRVPLVEVPRGLWVTSPEDQILRKLDWTICSTKPFDRWPGEAEAHDAHCGAERLRSHTVDRRRLARGVGRQRPRRRLLPNRQRHPRRILRLRRNADAGDAPRSGHAPRSAGRSSRRSHPAPAAPSGDSRSPSSRSSHS